MQDIKYPSSLQGHPWLHEHRVAVSYGKPSKGWAEILKSRRAPLAAWLKGQLGTKREGGLDVHQYAELGERAKTDKEAKKRKDAEKAAFSWYSLAAYQDGHRCGDGWQGSNIVVLDADAKYGAEEGAEYAFSGDQLRERLDGLLYVAMPTHSYTDEVPRWRILIPLSETVTNRQEFAAIAKHLGERLDGYVDPRSYTPEQLWFSFSAPKGEWEKRVSLVMVGG